MTESKWCRKFITEEEHLAISKEVASAEAKTSGEIIPVIVRESSATGHVRLILSLLFLFILFACADVHKLIHEYFAWTDTWWAPLAYLLSMLGLIALTWYLMGFLSRRPEIKRWFISVPDQIAQVNRRALLEFYLANLKGTEGHTGVLIFLSILERRAVVLADQGIAGKLPADAWDGVIQLVISGIKHNRPADGLLAGIERCGELLAEHFPPRPGDKNELPNQLIIKE
jgi:putative membrane protein